MMIGRLQGPDAGSQNVAHILVFHLLKILHVEDLTLFGRQLCYRLLQLALSLVTVKATVASPGGFTTINHNRRQL